MSCFKKGDRVRRIVAGSGPTGAIGYEFVVASVYGNYVYEATGDEHLIKNIEKVPSTVKEQIAELQKQLDALKDQEVKESLDNAKVLRHKARGVLYDIIGRHGDFLWIAPQDGSNPISFHRKDMDRFEIVESNCGC